MNGAVVRKKCLCIPFESEIDGGYNSTTLSLLSQLQRGIERFLLTACTICMPSETSSVLTKSVNIHCTHSKVARFKSWKLYEYNGTVCVVVAPMLQEI